MEAAEGAKCREALPKPALGGCGHAFDRPNSKQAVIIVHPSRNDHCRYPEVGSRING